MSRLIDADALGVGRCSKDKVEGIQATDCKYCQDEICVNAECPMCADCCAVPDIPGVCRFEEREEAQ